MVFASRTLTGDILGLCTCKQPTALVMAQTQDWSNLQYFRIFYFFTPRGQNLGWHTLEFTAWEFLFFSIFRDIAITFPCPKDLFWVLDKMLVLWTHHRVKKLTFEKTYHLQYKNVKHMFAKNYSATESTVSKDPSDRLGQSSIHSGSFCVVCEHKYNIYKSSSKPSYQYCSATIWFIFKLYFW